LRPFPLPLLEGVLLRRRKRFLADVRLASGEETTAHCPNPGAMTTCCAPGQSVLLSDRGARGRRLRYTWEIARSGRTCIGVNPQIANRIVGAWIDAGRIPMAKGPIRPEVRRGRSRFDFELADGALLEVKAVTLCRARVAAFPDAPTERGARHLRALAAHARRGRRCVLLYLVMRSDARAVRSAEEIDPRYARAARDAVRAGVEVVALQARFSVDGVAMGPFLEVRL